MDWTWIEETPSENTVIGLGFITEDIGPAVRVMQWKEGKWYIQDDTQEFSISFMPTHWLPLPSLPAAAFGFPMIFKERGYARP